MPPLPIRSVITTLLLTLLTFARAMAQDGVTVNAQPQFSQVKPGQNMAIAVTFDFAKNLHIWPNKPEIPDGADGLSAIPTEIVLPEKATVPAGFTVLLDKIQWPKAERVEVEAGTAKVTILAYHTKTTVYVPVVVAPDAKAGKYSIPLSVNFQACDDKSCFPPDERAITVNLVVGAESIPASAELFAGFDDAVFSKASATPAPAPDLSTPSKPDETIDLGVAGLRIPKGGLVGYTLLFVVAFVGGLILNLTPCVLPVIPLKILGLQAQAGSRSRMLYLGFVMFCGLVFFWLVLGGLISYGVLNAVSEISAYWQFNIAVAAFMAVMGLAMFGLFTVGLPGWVYGINLKHDSAKGSFGFGIMSAVLATPCVAPLVGGVAGASSQFSTPVAMLIFTFVGLGMGTPYLVLAAFPKLIAWLPRAGPGSELLKQVLALLMIAISLFFFGNGLITLVAEMPWLGKQLHWWAVAVAVLAACGWLILRTWQITPSLPRRAVFTILALLMTAGSFMWASNQTKAAEHEWDRAEEARLKDLASHSDPSKSTALWQEYIPQNVDGALADGRVVIMDFTADWCLICKTLEASVLRTDTVETALKGENVRSYKVDLTSRKAQGWKRLDALGQKGVPTLAILGPGLDKPWVRNAYTVGEVLDALKQAQGPAKRADSR